MPANEQNEIECRFRLTRGEFELDVDLQLPASGVSGVFGPSAAGKTSLLRCIAGLERADEGRLVVGGETWQDTGNNVFRDVNERRIGYVFQDARLFPHLDVRGNLTYGVRRTSAENPVLDLDGVAELLGLYDLLQRRPETLSGGEAQRVAIGRALLRSPKLLLFDEPLASLDTERRYEILPLVEHLRDELALPIVYVSHNIDELCRLADRLIVIDAGKLVAEGNPQSVLTDRSLPVIEFGEACTVIDATVNAYDKQYGITHAAYSGGELLVPGRAGEVGDALRMRIRANDVSLCLEPPQSSSILNILPATIESMEPENAATALVRLLSGDDRLLARVTCKSLEKLEIAPGSAVFAQIKSVVVR